MPNTWLPVITSPLQRGPAEQKGAIPRRLLLALAGAMVAAAPASATPKVYTLTIRDMAFGAVPAGLRVGDVIEWVNNDIFVHSATARDKTFDLELKPKAHARMTLKQAGTVAFYCRYHPGMTGRLVVGK
ncbi:MAG: cupredoxin domain-containing protein [Phenylobacterium sp.]